jgi:hypothetical protein
MAAEGAQLVFSLVGQLVAAGGGGAIVAFALFRFLGKSWIQNEFSKDLEVAKAEISLLTARRLKLHDREYEVFPEAWSKLNRASESLGRAIASFRTMPDLKRMDAEELSGWIERSDLSAGERDFLLKEHDKNRALSRIMDVRGVSDAHKHFSEFHLYIHENRIFLSPDLKEKIDEIDQLMWSSWVSKSMDLDGYGRDEGKSYIADAWSIYQDKVVPLKKEIEALVQAKLFPDAKIR